MALRLAGEDYSVVLGLDDLGWLKEMEGLDFDLGALGMIRSRNNGNIVLQPNGTGIIDLQKSIRNTSANNGGVIYLDDDVTIAEQLKLTSGNALDTPQVLIDSNNNAFFRADSQNGTPRLELMQGGSHKLWIDVDNNRVRFLRDGSVEMMAFPSNQVVKLSRALNLTHASVKTANYTTTDADTIVPVDTSGGAVTITLASATVEAGRMVIVKDSGGSAGTNAITVDTQGAETIDGGASVSINANYGVVRLYSDGANWFTF